MTLHELPRHYTEDGKSTTIVLHGSPREPNCIEHLEADQGEHREEALIMHFPSLSLNDGCKEKRGLSLALYIYIIISYSGVFSS